MKTLYNAAMAAVCFVLVVVIDAVFDANDYPQG